MKKIYSSEVLDALTAVGIIAGYYALMAIIVLIAW